jgi:hypothetical protein
VVCVLSGLGLIRKARAVAAANRLLGICVVRSANGWDWLGIRVRFVWNDVILRAGW